MWVDKKQLVMFIVAAINSTKTSTSKTTNIQIIVKAAVDQLGMDGLDWEEIQRDIKKQSSSQAPDLNDEPGASRECSNPG